MKLENILNVLAGLVIYGIISFIFKVLIKAYKLYKEKTK